MPKRPRGVEIIPAAEWGTIASKLQAEGIGKPEVHDAIADGDGVKALARWTRRRLARLRNPAAKQQKPVIPQRLRKEAAERLLAQNEEELQTELLAVEVALAANKAFQDPLYYERESREEVGSETTFIGTAGLAPEEWEGLSDEGQVQCAALAAADCWVRRGTSGAAAIRWARNLMLAEERRLWFRHIEYDPYWFASVMTGFANWHEKGLGTCLEQLIERLEEIASTRQEKLDELILSPLADAWGKSPYRGARAVIATDTAKAWARKIKELKLQLEGYILKHLEHGQETAVELRAGLPDPQTIPHDEAISMIRTMELEGRVFKPRSALEASAEDHITRCSTKWCAPLREWLTADGLPGKKKDALMQEALDNLKELRKDK